MSREKFRVVLLTHSRHYDEGAVGGRPPPEPEDEGDVLVGLRAARVLLGAVLGLRPLHLPLAIVSVEVEQLDAGVVVEQLQRDLDRTEVNEQ